MRRLVVTVTMGWLALQGSVVPAHAQDLGATIDSVFAPWRRSDAPGCMVGVRHATTEYRRAYGMANLEYGIALSPESVSEAGSVAKQFTVAAVVLLALDGKLFLDDDVRKYVPEVPDFGTTITLRHLLHHTSGIRDHLRLLSLAGRSDDPAVHTIGAILNLVSRQRMLNFAPGDEYLYSNTGYRLLGVVVSRVAGQSFADFTKRRFFGPLGMNRTEWKEDYRKVVPGRATGYSWYGNQWIQDIAVKNVFASGGLLTTVGDLLTWNDALTTGRLAGGTALVRLLETPGRLNDETELTYALGLSVSSYRGLRQVSHSGSSAGYRAYLVRWPERELSIAVLCNAANARPTQLARGVAHAVIGGGVPDAPPSPPVALTVADLEPLAGTYRDSTTDQFVTFAVRDRQLMVSGSGPDGSLTPLGNGRFWGNVAGLYSFERVGGLWQVRERSKGPRLYVPHVPVDTSDLQLEEYEGRYRSPELDTTIEVQLKQGRLQMLRPPASGVMSALAPAYVDGFWADGLTVRFTRGADKNVMGLSIFAGRVRDLRFDRLTQPPGDP